MDNQKWKIHKVIISAYAEFSNANDNIFMLIESDNIIKLKRISI